MPYDYDWADWATNLGFDPGPAPSAPEDFGSGFYENYDYESEDRKRKLAQTEDEMRQAEYEAALNAIDISRKNQTPINFQSRGITLQGGPGPVNPSPGWNSVESDASALRRLQAVDRPGTRTIGVQSGYGGDPETQAAAAQAMAKFEAVQKFRQMGGGPDAWAQSGIGMFVPTADGNLTAWQQVQARQRDAALGQRQTEFQNRINPPMGYQEVAEYEGQKVLNTVDPRTGKIVPLRLSALPQGESVKETFEGEITPGTLGTPAVIRPGWLPDSAATPGTPATTNISKYKATRTGPAASIRKPETSGSSNIPESHIKYLLENPGSAASFDRRYGKGSAALYLR